MRKLFLRALEDGHEMLHSRPSYEQWVDELQRCRILLGDPARTFRGPPRGFDLSILPRDYYHEPLEPEQPLIDEEDSDAV
jgi:hypothetical protein